MFPYSGKLFRNAMIRSPARLTCSLAWNRDDALERLELHEDPSAVGAEPTVAPALPGIACEHVNPYQVSRKARVRTASGRNDSKYVPDGRRCRDCGDLVDRGEDRLG